MRRLAFAALVAAAGCSDVTELGPGPADRVYFPTGVAVTSGGHLVVASSNFDLRYDDETGGSVLAVDPDPALATARLLGTVNVQSLGGQLALADPASCTALDPAAGAIAILPVRGSNLVYRLKVAADGAVSCPDCALAVGAPTRVDPWAAGVACGPGLARAYVGYLRTSTGQASITQIDLTRDPSEDGAVQHFAHDLGQVRGFAYDAALERLYVTHTVTGGSTSLRWVDVGGGCRVDVPFADGGCATGTTVADAIPSGLELRAVALSSSSAPRRRAYLTARVHDPALAAAAGYRTGDFGGKLVVAELVETLGGQVDLAVVRDDVDLGYGAADVVALPPRAGLRDLVAALATDSGRVTIYDDEAGAVVATIGADLAGTGAPLLGHVPIALAVDPVVRGNVARLYVASFQESYVTAIDVPLDDPAAACLVGVGGGCAAGPDTVRRISGGTP